MGKKLRRKLASVGVWFGLAIVIFTHVYVLAVGLPQEMVRTHAILNLIAGGLMLISGLNMGK
ncbi:hypothetical protein J4481_02120 [Candidatus Pacearchaeota archaeon]|nr:hypothetical protein [Candidatus Pacearchaeota archaeon]